MAQSPQDTPVPRSVRALRLVALLGLCIALQGQLGSALLAQASSASFSNGQAVVLVLGQPTFTTSTISIANQLDRPFALTVDATTGKVFVADSTNNRVLRFSSVVALTNGASAEAVLGQPDLASMAAATSQSGMFFPGSVTVDGSGTLWVADTNNNRVLRFAAASSKPSGANADGVLGQADFRSTMQVTSQSGMTNPAGVAVDASGTLWVAD